MARHAEAAIKLFDLRCRSMLADAERSSNLASTQASAQGHKYLAQPWA